MKVLHGYSGSCAPGETTCRFLTFSVGIFPILPKSGGKGTKKGKSIVRVVGPTSKPELVYAKAREIVDLLDAGKYTGPKRVTV